MTLGKILQTGSILGLWVFCVNNSISTKAPQILLESINVRRRIKKKSQKNGENCLSLIEQGPKREMYYSIEWRKPPRWRKVWKD